MTSKRATIYIPEDMSTQLGPCDNLSGRLAAIVDRYSIMVLDLMPNFSRNEWCAICDANSGTDMMGGLASPTMIWANVHDSIRLDEKWSIDQDALVKRLQQLRPSELLAVAEVCVRFWQLDKCDTDTALRLAGALPMEDTAK